MPLTVSNAWKESIKGQFRRPGYLRVLLALVPDEIRRSVTAGSSQTEQISSLAQLNDGITITREPVATFEKNRWKGDGSQYLPSPEANLNEEIEWWSDTTQFNKDNPIELTFTFSRYFSFAGLFTTWDTETNSWPTDWEIIGYDALGNITKKYEIKNTQSVESYADAPFDDVTMLRIRIFAWSAPEWRVRINEVMFGTFLNFSNDNITSAEFSASSSLITEDLPTCQFSFTFNNYDKLFDPQLQKGYSKYLTQKQLLQAQWGFETSYNNVEWLDPWPLYLSSWNIPSNSQTVTLEAHSRLNFLDIEYHKGVYDGVAHNMYDIAEHILRNSNIIKEQDPEIPWEIAPGLKNFYTRAPMPIAASNALLQLIANATGHLLDTNLRNGFVRIKSGVVNTDYEVGINQQMGDPSFEIRDRLKSVKVGLHSFSPKGETSEVFKTELDLSGTTEITCYYNSDAIVRNPVASATNATITVGATYARVMILEVTPIDISQPVSIVINGEEIAESVTMLEMYNNPEVPRGIEVEVDNELITEMETVEYLANYLVDYFSRRNHLSVSYLGYPELEVGDRIQVPTTYGDDFGDIIGTKLSFNGGFNGTLDIVSVKEE